MGMAVSVEQPTQQAGSCEANTIAVAFRIHDDKSNNIINVYETYFDPLAQRSKNLADLRRG
jgi:hypothetical protein